MAKKTENIAMEAELEARDTKAALEAQPKVKIKIPKMKDRQDAFVPVQINGYKIEVPVGETTSVPESVAAILENAGYI